VEVVQWLDEIEAPESHLDACKLEAARIYQPLTLTAADQAKLNETLDEIFGTKK
jgi:hypothetical protein